MLTFFATDQYYPKHFRSLSEKVLKRSFLCHFIWRSILSQQPKTEWKCAYNELLSGRKDMQRQNDDPLSGPIRKKSKPSEDSTDEPDHETKTERQRVRFKGVDDSETETSTCPACKQIIVKETEEYDSLMEKSVTMVTLHFSWSEWFGSVVVCSIFLCSQASPFCRNYLVFRHQRAVGTHLLDRGSCPWGPETSLTGTRQNVDR